MNYNKVVQVKVTDEQFEKIKKEAKKVGLPRTTFIRFIVLDKLKQSEGISQYF